MPKTSTSVGAPIPATKFGAGIAGGGATRGRLASSGVTGAGGHFQRNEWRDIVRNESCTFGVAADGSWRCLPTAIRIADTYADAACTRPLAIEELPSCFEPKYASSVDLNACPPRTTLRLLTSRVTPSKIYGPDQPSGCSERTAAMPLRFWGFDAEVAATDFQLATERIE